ncbi:MAG: DUF1360 domain-containing protein [Bacillaceae bacterium]|nr:DUF1360 domain-containing protein [Bacillaceae bacterium]
MDISIFEFVIICLAAFRLTRLLVYDTISGFIRKPFHEIVEETSASGEKETFIVIKGKENGIRYWIGYLLSCYWCVSVWMAFFSWLFYSLYPTVTGPILLIAAVAGVAAIIEAYVSRVIN